MLRILSWTIVLVSLYACSGSKAVLLAKKGSVEQHTFNQEIPFRYVKDHLFIDVEIRGEVYNFLFDTGFDFTVIDEGIQLDEFTPSFQYTTSGSSFETRMVNYGTIPELTIDGVRFLDLGAGRTDLDFINQHYVCEQKADGVVGANLLRKAKWQIDYQNQVIRFTDDMSNFNLGQDPIKMRVADKGWGSFSIRCELNGIKENFVFDTGSSGKFTVGLELYDQFKATDATLDQLVTIYGKTTAYKGRVARLQQFEVGGIPKEQTTLSFEKVTSSLIGNQFLEQYLITLNGVTGDLFLSPGMIVTPEPLRFFDLSFQPDYDELELIVSGRKEENSLNQTVEVGTQVLAINDYDLKDLTLEELCEFWNKDKAELLNADQIRVLLEGHGDELILSRKSW